MARQRQETLNALDAAGIATARYIAQGATDAQAKTYTKDFFEARWWRSHALAGLCSDAAGETPYWSNLSDRRRGN